MTRSPSASAKPTALKKGQPLKIIYRRVEDLIPYAKNARTHSAKQVGQLAEAIQRFGFTNPVLIDEKDGIIAGHGRLLGAQKLQMDEVPTITLAGLTAVEKRALVIADNKLALNAGWDIDILKQEFTALSAAGFDAQLTGFSLTEISHLGIGQRGGLTDPDHTPALSAAVVSKLGDVWILGSHRIVCGDSTDPVAFAGVMGKAKASLLCSDPPYGIGYKYRTHADKPADNALLVANAFKFGPEGKVWTPGLMNLRRDLDRFGQSKVLVWHKGYAQSGNGLGGAGTWEPVLVVSPPAKNLPDDHLYFSTDREKVGGVNLRELHTCPKPVALFAHLIGSLTKKQAIIYDPFMGSGTTLIAAETMGRTAIGIELDPAYVDLIVRRWQEFTGKRAVLDAKGSPAFVDVEKTRCGNQRKKPTRQAKAKDQPSLSSRGTKPKPAAAPSPALVAAE
jgi:hypothetical protein